MLDILPLLPPVLLLPSYRTVLMCFYFITSVFLTYVYIISAKMVLGLVGMLTNTNTKSKKN